MFQTFSVISLVYFSRSSRPFSMVLERKQRERRVGGRKGKREERVERKGMEQRGEGRGEKLEKEG